MTVRELLRTKIEQRGLSMKAISLQLGKNHAYLQQFIERGIPRRLPEDVRPKLAAALGVKETDLIESGQINAQLLGTRPQAKKAVPDVSRGVTNDGPENLLKVLGMAEGGPNGWNLWNGEIVQYITRPENLRGVPGAYAVYVTGHSMEPRYEPGELVHVHPGRPVQPGSYVLVQRKPLHEGEPPLAVLKRLVRRSGSKVTLEQLNPPERFDVPAGDVISIHKVVGSSEA